MLVDFPRPARMSARTRVLEVVGGSFFGVFVGPMAYQVDFSTGWFIRSSSGNTSDADTDHVVFIPTALLLVATVLLSWLERLRWHRSLLWNSGIGLIIGPSALR